MHVLTKFLVVVAAVLSVALSALTIAYTANATRIAAGYTSLEQKLASETTTNQAQFSQHAHIEAQWAQERSDLQNERTALESEYAKARGENALLLADKQRAEAQLLAIQSQITQLTATGQTMSLLVENYREELTGLRDNQLRGAEREIQLADRINDLTGQIEVAQDTNRALQEQLVEVQDALALATGDLGDIARGSGGGTGVVQARITNVSRDRATGDFFAEINAGTNDRIKEGMEMTIARDGDFLAKFVVTRVDLQTAVGKIDTLRRNVTVQPGDIVLSSLR